MLRLFKCLLLQFIEDLSDRKLMRFLEENNAAKWFVGFGLAEITPEHTVFCKFRKRLGTKFLSEVFRDLREQLKRQGLMNEVFSFVDPSHLIAKASLWEERDRAIQGKYERLNNEVLPKAAIDKQARIGCKGQSKFWYGYKKHTSVDMQSGLINKIAIRPANESDAKGLAPVCPTQGSIYADKAYCVSRAKKAAAKRGCHLAAIKKNNMKDKNIEQDRWYTKLRSPYERVFSQQNRRVRYRGIMKNQFAAMMEAIGFNLKRLCVLDPPNLCLS
ncbi:MAG: transposase [Gammaproteobacteria bacterium]